MTVLELHLHNQAVWSLDGRRAIWIHSPRAGWLRVPANWIPYLLDTSDIAPEVLEQLRPTQGPVKDWLDRAGA